MALQTPLVCIKQLRCAWCLQGSAGRHQLTMVSLQSISFLRVSLCSADIQCKSRQMRQHHAQLVKLHLIPHPYSPSKTLQFKSKGQVSNIGYQSLYPKFHPKFLIILFILFLFPAITYKVVTYRNLIPGRAMD